MSQGSATRRQFIALGMASTALMTRPWAVAAATPNADAVTAERVLQAASLSSFNDLPPSLDFARPVQAGLAHLPPELRGAFTQLRRLSPGFDDLDAADAATSLAKLLAPTYPGPTPEPVEDQLRKASQILANARPPESFANGLTASPFAATGGIAPEEVRNAALLHRSTDVIERGEAANDALLAASVLIQSERQTPSKDHDNGRVPPLSVTF